MSERGGSGSSQNALIALSFIAIANANPGLAMAACSSALITVSAPTALNFATILPCATANTVTITTNGARSGTGCLSLSGSHFIGAVHVASNQDKGNDSVRVYITQTSVTLSPTAGTQTMTANSFDFKPKNGPPITQGGKASVTYSVGGTLSVGANQDSGSYAGTITIHADCL